MLPGCLHMALNNEAERQTAPYVVISDEAVGSPLVSCPSAAIVLNNPSFDKFEPCIRAGGLLITNSSLVTRISDRKDITIIEVKATETANELGNSRAANMILLGAFVANTDTVLLNSVNDSLVKVLSGKQHLIPMNMQALEMGASFAALTIC